MNAIVFITNEIYIKYAKYKSKLNEIFNLELQDNYKKYINSGVILFNCTLIRYNINNIIINILKWLYIQDKCHFELCDQDIITNIYTKIFLLNTKYNQVAKYYNDTIIEHHAGPNKDKLNKLISDLNL